MSSNTIYTSINATLLSCTSLKAQKELIELMLMNMLIAIQAAIQSGQYSEYKLDTGQTVTEIRFRSLLELQRAYTGLLKNYQDLNNLLGFTRTGRQFRLVDGRNFPGRGYYFNQ